MPATASTSSFSICRKTGNHQCTLLISLSLFLHLIKSYHSIDSIEAGAFDQLHSLEWLNLHSNQLKHLPAVVFERALSKILILDVHGKESKFKEILVTDNSIYNLRQSTGLQLLPSLVPKVGAGFGRKESNGAAHTGRQLYNGKFGGCRRIGPGEVGRPRGLAHLCRLQCPLSLCSGCSPPPIPPPHPRFGPSVGLVLLKPFWLTYNGTIVVKRIRRNRMRAIVESALVGKQTDRQTDSARTNPTTSDQFAVLFSPPFPPPNIAFPPSLYLCSSADVLVKSAASAVTAAADNRNLLSWAGEANKCHQHNHQHHHHQHHNNNNSPKRKHIAHLSHSIYLVLISSFLPSALPPYQTHISSRTINARPSSAQALLGFCSLTHALSLSLSDACVSKPTMSCSWVGGEK